MDFMNLNQSAHGDREFGYIETRLRQGAQDRRRALAGSRPSRGAIGSWARAAGGWHDAHHLRVARFGDNMRQVAVTEGDKVEAAAPARVLGQRVRRRRARAPPSRRADEPAVDATSSPSTRTTYDLAPELRTGGRSPRVAPRGGPIELALRGFLDDGRLRRLHRHLRGPRRPAAAARDRRPAADGRWLRVRRRGRLEDRGPRPAAEGHGVRAARAARRSWRTTRTTSTPRARWSLARTCSRSARRSRATDRLRDPSARDRRQGRSGSAGVHRAPRPGHRGRPRGPWRHASGSSPTRSTSSRRRSDLPRLPVGRAVWRPRPTLDVAAEAWLIAGGPHHTGFSTALGLEVIDDFAEIAGHRARS